MLLPCAGEEVVDAEHVVAVVEQPLAQVRAEEACPARHQNGFSLLHFSKITSRAAALVGLNLDARFFALLENERIDFLHDPR